MFITSVTTVAPRPPINHRRLLFDCSYLYICKVEERSHTNGFFLSELSCVARRLPGEKTSWRCLDRLQDSVESVNCDFIVPRHLFYVRPSWERNPSPVALTEVSSIFFFFFNIAIKSLRTEDEACRSLYWLWSPLRRCACDSGLDNDPGCFFFSSVSLLLITGWLIQIYIFSAIIRRWQNIFLSS